MQNLVLTLLVNGLMAALLLATMIYCRRLNTRIKVLQDSKSELARIVRDFDESTARATQSIADIHAAADRISDNIQHKIDKANFLADDLQYMIEKGQKIAGKPEVATAAPQPAVAAPRPARAEAAASSLMPGKRAEASPKAFIMDDDASAGAAAPAAPRGNRMRSRAEQEIMSALSGKKAGE